MPIAIIHAIALIKSAAATTNEALGKLDARRARAIEGAAPDYALPSPFATSFKCSRFDETQRTPPRLPIVLQQSEEAGPDQQGSLAG